MMNIITKMLCYGAVFIIAFSCTSRKISKFGNSQVGSLYAKYASQKSSTENNDFDQDGFPNAIDDCVSIPETFNFYMDNDGCPDNFNYSDEKLEIKNINIFSFNTPLLSSKIKSLIKMKFSSVLTKYPETHWIIDVKAAENEKKKAMTIKEFIDETIGTNKRTRIIYSHTEFEKVYLRIDNVKARKIALSKLKNIDRK